MLQFSKNEDFKLKNAKMPSLKGVGELFLRYGKMANCIFSVVSAFEMTYLVQLIREKSSVNGN